MSTQPRDGSALDLREAAAEDEVLKLEEEVQHMAEKILQFRAVLPGQLSSTLSSFLASQRPVLQTQLSDEGPETESGALPGLDSEAGVSQGFELENMGLLVAEAEKIQLLNQKISRNVTMLPVVLNRMEECIARIDKLASYNGIIHPAFKRKWTVDQVP